MRKKRVNVGYVDLNPNKAKAVEEKCKKLGISKSLYVRKGFEQWVDNGGKLQIVEV